MANTKISDLTALTTPTGSEDFVYAKSGANGKVSLDVVKGYVTAGLPQVITQAAYDALPSSKNTDGIIRFIYTTE